MDKEWDHCSDNLTVPASALLKGSTSASSSVSSKVVMKGQK